MCLCETAYSVLYKLEVTGNGGTGRYRLVSNPNTDPRLVGVSSRDVSGVVP